MRRLTLIATIAVLALAGCGGDDEKAPSGGGSSSSSGDGGENLTIAADPGGALKFDTNTLTAKAGKVTITMDNPSDTPHNVAIDVEGAEEGQTVGKDEKSEASADLKAGEYKYYCAVGNHRAEGMEGTLTVN